MKLTQYTDDITSRYSTWRSNRIKDIVLHPRNDIVQPVNPLLEKILSEVEVLNQEFETEKRQTRKEN